MIDLSKPLYRQDTGERVVEGTHFPTSKFFCLKGDAGYNWFEKATGQPYDLNTHHKFAVTNESLGSLKPGDRVEIDTPVLHRGETGVIARIPMNSRVSYAMVKLDKDGVERSFLLSNLKKLENNMTYANRVKNALANLVSNTKPGTVRQAIQQLAAATVACTIANGAKDKAKKALVDLGIADSEYREGTVTIFDDNEFKVEAVTKAATSRLDQAMLKDLLRGYGLSQSKINAAFVGATFDNKPATSFVVTEK